MVFPISEEQRAKCRTVAFRAFRNFELSSENDHWALEDSNQRGLRKQKMLAAVVNAVCDQLENEGGEQEPTGQKEQ